MVAAGGGWVQHDETLNSFDAVIHQVTEGRLFIQKHFGVKPRVGWQIDTFGHSRLTAWLAEQLQLDGGSCSLLLFFLFAQHL